MRIGSKVVLKETVIVVTGAKAQALPIGTRGMLDDAEGQCGDVKMRWTSRKTRSVDIDGLAAAYPDIYARFVTEKVRPGFEVKLKKPAKKKEQEAA